MIYNPYHEALVGEKIGKIVGYRPIKNLNKKWYEFINNLKKDGYTCIKVYSGLIKANNKKGMINYKI
jgi:hypothetical protein